jgi:AcrR family transcriptional regulator
MATRRRPARHERVLRPIPPGVLRAARKTFLHRGVHRTTMGDIAEEAGIPRPTLYEYVTGQHDLVDAVLVQRVRHIARQLELIATSAPSFREAVVETSVEAIMLTRRDREITNIFATAPNLRVHEILEGPHAEVRKIVGEFLQPILGLGQSSGQLRDDVGHDLITDWFRAVYTSYILRENLDIDEVRTMMREFLLPSLLSTTPAQGPLTSRA